MVEENFKIGIELEVEQDSLAAITKQVEQAVRQAYENATAGAARRGPQQQQGAARPGGGAATARSIAQTTGVTQQDFTQAVRDASRENQQTAARFDKAAEVVVQSLDRLTKALERRAAGGAPVPPESPTKVIVEKQTGPTNKNQGRDALARQTEAGRRPSSSGGTTERPSDLRESM